MKIKKIIPYVILFTAFTCMFLYTKCEINQKKIELHIQHRIAQHLNLIKKELFVLDSKYQIIVDSLKRADDHADYPSMVKIDSKISEHNREYMSIKRRTIDVSLRSIEEFKASTDNFLYERDFCEFVSISDEKAIIDSIAKLTLVIK